MIDDMSIGILGICLLRNPRRRMVEVVCCESCDSINVLRRSSRAGSAMAQWACRDCGHWFKEPAQTGHKKPAGVIP